ncbi:Uncharacterised protein [Mycobacterium tuberculosis]|uniref:Uncharacterized protein n=1 Tax=Mycobacterium tuberculosis TaxID=1773 RepID=A0A654U2C5_MYCTX|nr:Uncharacterised protein [Mycobacterium tuberculosis]
MTACTCSLFSIRMATTSSSRRPAWRNQCANRLARASNSSKLMTVPDGYRMTAGLSAPIYGRICMRRGYVAARRPEPQGAIPPITSRNRL